MTDVLRDFTDALTARGRTFVVDGGRVTVGGGYVSLPSLTTLPEGAAFNNGGYVSLPSLTTLPEGAAFNNGGYVWLPSLTTLPEGAAFNNGGDVYLRSLTTLPEGAAFNNGGDVSLPSLTTLPEGAAFNNGGDVWLPSLTTLPEGAAFNNGGGVYLPSLPAGIYAYAGTHIRIENIDGYTMVVQSERTRGEYRIMSCRYFGGGDISKLRRCYVAQRGKYSAHGETVEKALRDLRFKERQADFDADELIETIRARGTIEFNDFRLLTGACEEGLRHGLKQAGLSPDTEVMPLADALRAAHGPYGAAFREMFA